MNRIKILLVQQGRSQKWLSKGLGKSYVVVTNYVNNKRQPSLVILCKIAALLDVDVRELLNSDSSYDSKKRTP
jgi:putative transcriptional regulator